jgi:hypothetical protein
MEKDPNRKFFLSGKLGLIALVFLMAILGMAVLFYFLRKKESNVDTGIDKE